jgi:hypothetical protein
MNPYDAPAWVPVATPGTFDPGRAITEGFRAIASNLPQTLAVAFIAVVAYYLSFCTCVGWVVVLPLLTHGAYKFMLEAIDGQARVATLWSGAADFGGVFVRMWGIMLLLTVIFVPVIAVVAAIVVVPLVQGHPLDPVLQYVAISVPSSLYGLIIVRVTLAPFAVVERGLSPVDAVSYAWEVTAGNWGKLMLLQLAIIVISAPAGALSVLVQTYAGGLGQDPTDPLAALSGSMGLLGLNLIIMLLSMITGLFSFAMYGSAWRQLAGTSAA